MNKHSTKEENRRITHISPYIIGSYLGYSLSNKNNNINNTKAQAIKDLVNLKEINKKSKRIETLGSIKRLGISGISAVMFTEALNKLGIGNIIYKEK